MATTSASMRRTDGKTSACSGLVWLNSVYASFSSCRCCAQRRAACQDQGAARLSARCRHVIEAGGQAAAITQDSRMEQADRLATRTHYIRDTDMLQPRSMPCEVRVRGAITALK